MKRVIVHTAMDGAYDALERLQIVGALRFPERRGGPDSCVRELLALLERTDDAVLITAYADTINFLGMTEEMKLTSTVIHLHRPEGVMTTHLFNEEGYLTDWPFGCLSGDFDEALFKLKQLVGGFSR